MKRRRILIGAVAVAILLAICLWPRPAFRFLGTFHASRLEAAASSAKTYELQGSFDEVCQAVEKELSGWTAPSRKGSVMPMPMMRQFAHPDGSYVTVLKRSMTRTEVEIGLTPSWLERQWEWLLSKFGQPSKADSGG